VVTRGSTYENRANLAPGFFEQVIRKYEGTRLGRQELLAEVLEDTPGALWNREQLDQCRREQVPAFPFTINHSGWVCGSCRVSMPRSTSMNWYAMDPPWAGVCQWPRALSKRCRLISLWKNHAIAE
jgi:hypothetical protein